MNASRSLVGSFISGMRVEVVTTADVFEGAERALDRSEFVEVAIGAMVVNGVSSIGRASCWLTFWLTPPSFERPTAGSTFLGGGGDAARDLTCLRAPPT